jgi:hypothetical protein
MILKPISFLSGKALTLYDTGWLQPTRGISNNKIGEGTGWGFPGNIATESTTDSAGQMAWDWTTSRGLFAAGFSSALAAIDGDAEIVGIEAKVTAKISFGDNDSSAWITRGIASGLTGTTDGTQLGVININPSVPMKTTTTEHVFGGDSDLWGCSSLTIGQFKDDDYCGVGVRASQIVLGNDTLVYTFSVKFYYLG